MRYYIFRGPGVAAVTPSMLDGAVDYPTLKRLIRYQLDSGVDSLRILAAAGETPCLTLDEKNRITELIKKEDEGLVPILKCCGGSNTTQMIEEMKVTDWIGIDGILSICPYCNRPSQEGLYRHFGAIASASPLPVVMYNVPGRAGASVKAETMVRLAHDYENVTGIKEAAGSLEQVDEIIKGKPDRFDIISGDDTLTFFMIASGTAGVISVTGNALPREFPRMIRLEFQGEYEAARRIHHMFTELYSFLFADGSPAGVRALLNNMGYIENVLHLLLVPTTIKTKEKIADILKEMRI